MKKSKVTRSLLAACSIVALSAVMYGCVHSGDGPTYSQLDLMGGHNTAAGATVAAGTYGIDGLPADLASALEGYTGPTTAGAGEALTIGGYTFTCGDDSSCSVTVAPDGSHFTTTGTITVAAYMEPEPTPYETAKTAIAAATTAEAAQAAYDAVKDDVTAAQGELLQAAVDNRIAALNTADRVAEQKMALANAAGMIDTSDEALSTQGGVDAARTAIAGLRQAIDDADDVDDTSMYETMLTNAVDAVDEAQGGIDTATRRTNQMTALSGASDTLQAALAALAGSTPTQAQLDAANNALTALKAAITDGADLTDAEKATYVREAANAVAPIATAQTAFDDAEEDATKAANDAMAVTASRLHAGISEPSGNPASPAVTDRAAAYNAADAPTTGTAADTLIMVSIGDGTNVPTAVALSEDKKSPVDDFHGWEGKQYTAEPDGDAGTYKAVVYSNVGKATQGAKFNSGTGDGNVGFALDATDGDVDIEAGLNLPARIASPSFDHTAGYKTFELPDPNPSGADIVVISGSYYGVAGTYACTPAVAADGCRVNRAADGYTLALTGDGGGTWAFTPTNPNARVTETPDADYASYGWWIHKSENGMTYTASAFVDQKGAGEPAGGVTALQGTATYAGGAVGHYALSSATGGTNDAGQFTARATLEADFGDNMITGTIDGFMGDDGEAKNWSVELMEQGVGNTGIILGDDGTGTAKNTKWTIGGTAADAAGSWSGGLYDDGDDGVPQVATGTFYSTYGTAGKMVGAFGANKQ